MLEGATSVESTVHADTVNIVPMEDGKKGTSGGSLTSAGISNGLSLVALVFIGCLALLAVILAVVAIGRSSKADSGDDYVWTFAVGHFGNALEYIDESTGQVSGFSIDLVDAVCKEANKNCEVIWDVYENCWSSEPGVPAHGGVGLLGRWYDGCATWVQTRRRMNTFKFSTPFVGRQSELVALYTAPTNDVFDWRDMTGRTVGFIDGFAVEDSCFMMYDEIQGFNKSNVRYFATMGEFTAAIKQNEVDCGFTFLLEGLQSQLKVLTPGGLEDKCWVGAHSIMTRKDSGLTLWWNDAFDKIRANGKYREVCKDLIEVHGHPVEAYAGCLED